MKLRILSPFIILAGLALFVGMACSLSTPVPPTIAPVIPTHVVIQPTNPPPAFPTKVIPPTVPPAIPTRAPTLAPIPTNTKPPQSGDLIYSTTFNDLSDWNIYTKTDRSNYVIENRDYGLYITIPAVKDYADFYYDLGSADVRMEADVELVGGTNYTYFTLICRSSTKGEYAFTLDMGGYWQIGKWDFTSSSYKRLKDGGSVNINVAKAKNHMTTICHGNTLTFKINGITLATVTDSLYSEGEIGMEVKTFDYPHSESIIHNLAVYVP
jgi:hypothetical protein